MNIEELGFTKEELQNRVVDQLCEQLLTEIQYGDGEGEERVRSSLQRKLDEQIKKQINDTIGAIAEKHVLPRVSEMIEGITIQKTNEWGEKKGTSMTFMEYLVSRCEAYMQEQVDFFGKTKAEDSYNFKGCQTRVAYLINTNISHNIETAINGALKDINTNIAKGLYETCRLKINEAALAFTIVAKGK